MTRTRRVAIDQGFSSGGNSWYDSGQVDFPSSGYVTFDLPFAINLGGYGGNYSSTVTLWQNGVLSLGPKTDAQLAFFQSGADPVPGEGNPGFPGFFFLFDYGGAGTFHSQYGYGLGMADYEAPYHEYEAVNAAFFTFDENYQIILDENGFSFVEEEFNNTQTANGFFIGGQAQEFDGWVTDFDYYPDFLTYDNGSYVGTDYNEIFLSSPGGNLIDGKGGLDLLTYERSAAGVTVNLLTGAVSGGDAQGDQILNIEDLYGSAFGDTLTGSGGANFLWGLAGNDTIVGRDGNDTIEGGAGADTLDGGNATDTLSYLHSPSGVTVSLQDASASGGDATGDVFTGFERVTGSQFEDLLIASAAGNLLSGENGDDVLLGSLGGDSLYGGYGDDFLTGGAGGDKLDGGDGSDTVSYTDSPAALTINLSAHTVSGGDGTGDHLAAVENVVGTTFADSMIGNIDDNRLQGGTGDDILYGRVGDDILIGGNGADKLYGEDGRDTLMGGDGDDTLNGADGLDVLTGGGGADSVAGGLGNDILTGDDGNDVLNGGAGADSMTGGLGDDTFYVDNLGDIVIEGATGGTNDRIVTSISYAIAPGTLVERLEINSSVSTVAINLTGNGYANTLVGNSAANVLNGRAGADRMIGNGGDDTFYVDNVGDVVVEKSAAGGNDLVNSSIDFALPANVETLVLTGTAAINGTGNGLANAITGNAGNNVLTGAGGADTLSAGQGDDTINGGAGSDTLTGGLGHDAYVFSNPLGATNVDTIVGYSVGADVIDLGHAVFAGLALGALAEGAFNTGTAASEADDRIIYDSASGALLFDADGVGGTAAVQFATLDPGLPMSAGEFFVI
jgi:serralysin